MGFGAGPVKHQTDPRYNRKADITGTWCIQMMFPRNVPMNVLTIERQEDGTLKGVFYSEHDPQPALSLAWDGRILSFGAMLGTNGDELRRFVLQWMPGDFLMPVPKRLEAELGAARVPDPDGYIPGGPPIQDHDRFRQILGEENYLPNVFDVPEALLDSTVTAIFGYKLWADYTPYDHVRDMAWYKWRGFEFSAQEPPEFEYRLDGCELTRANFDR